MIPSKKAKTNNHLRKRKILAPLIIFIYCLILKGAILDGWHGWYYTSQRVLAELLLGIHIIEAEKIDIQQTQK